MKIEIEEKQKNPLLNRTEVHFAIMHENEPTPSKETIKEELAKELKEKKENIVIDYIKSCFGSQKSVGYAKIYKSIEDAKRIEPKYILRRNLLIEAPKKEEKAPAEEKKVEEVKEEPKEEKPAEGEKEVTKEETEESTEKQEITEEKSEVDKTETSSEKKEEEA
jgi:small subunit ribosomal protein S24e